MVIHSRLESVECPWKQPGVHNVMRLLADRTIDLQKEYKQRLTWNGGLVECRYQALEIRKLPGDGWVS
jgi:hypothetical protein